MKGKTPMTLAQMAARAAGQSGRLACPKCGCQDFRTYGTRDGHVQTFRYKACRHCGHKILTAQDPERVIRDVVSEIDDPRAVNDDFGGSIV